MVETSRCPVRATDITWWADRLGGQAWDTSSLIMITLVANRKWCSSPGKLAAMKTRIMYVELKTGFDNDGPAWIGRVQISKTGRTLYYRDKTLRRIPGGGIRGNHDDIETGDEYWVSGVKRNRANRPWAGTGPVVIDEEVRQEYEQLTKGH